MPEQLPPELFDDIFFYLRASEDFASLYAFTEINDFFHTLAEPHLYYHFTLSDHDLYDDSTVIVTQNSIFAGHSPLQVLNLLTDKPHIVTRGYVRSLKLLIEAETNYGGIMDTERRRRWSDDIARLIAPLTSLECVTMSQQGMGMLLWRQFSRDLQVAFGNMLNLPSLREVEICYLGLPLEVLCRSATLKRLRLSGSNVSFGTQGQGVSPRTPENQRASLSALNFRHTNYPSIVSWLGSGIGPDISRLQYLKATLEGAPDYQHVSYMLSLCSSSLEHLALDPGNTANLRHKVIARGQTVVMESPLSLYLFSPSPLFPSYFDAASLSGPFSLSCLSSLKHLELCLEMSGFSSFGRAYTSPFHFIHRVLTEISHGGPHDSRSSLEIKHQGGNLNRKYSRVQLERLVLNIEFNRDIMNFFDQIVWAPLTSTLSTFSDAMPSLEVVDLRAIIFGSTADHEEIANRLKDAVRILQANVHITPLITRGLVRISGKRLDSWSVELVDMV